MRQLHHGGRLREAAECYGIPLNDWLDLSTGINPVGWPVPAVSADCWQRLPEEGDGLEQAAADYYGSSQLLPVAGSQAAIQALPRLRTSARVGMLRASYAEHAAAWQRFGHGVVELSAEEIERVLPELDVLLLVNPNNPTGQSFEREQLVEWQQALVERGGWLVVDEAFCDAQPMLSMLGETGSQGLIVLRSLGKFFGLAGARVGFVFAWPQLLRQLEALLGPWALSGPAREVARRALGDELWQRQTRRRLQADSERLYKLLCTSGLQPAGRTSLFCYCPTPQAELLHGHLASAGVLTRLFSSPAALRFGLPGSEDEWQRLQQAVNTAMKATTQKIMPC